MAALESGLRSTESSLTKLYGACDKAEVAAYGEQREAAVEAWKSTAAGSAAKLEVWGASSDIGYVLHPKLGEVLK